ncbi:hypothetical protein [Aliiroseovarius sp. 2305UL8-7]|uniref:hypothetical protein n=1 Tax=Aliiroseovarius conchicola TaxID=3121637 RepID=UPI003527677F
MNNRLNQTALAGLTMLIILQAIMLMSLYAGIPPHPPATIPLGGIAPILAAGFAASGAAIVLGPTTSNIGRAFAILAVAIAMLSFGPQKYLNVQLPLIWPAVVLGQISAAMIVVSMFRNTDAVAAA